MKSNLSDYYGNRRVLVTGGASFIGSKLCENLVAVGARVTVADNLSSGRLDSLETVLDHINFIQGDLRDRAVAEAACWKQRIVFHLAAAHGGRGYIETHPVESCNNMVLDHTVFAAAAEAKVQKIIFASSACVYPTQLQDNETKSIALQEGDANFDVAGGAFADGDYGWAKLMGEKQLHAFTRQHQISGVACRIFTAYGERENESHAVIALIAKAVARLDPFPIWGSGQQTRNFTYVCDTVDGLMLSGARLEGFQAINVGQGREWTILALADEIFRALNWRPSRIETQHDKPVGVKSRVSNNSHCRHVLDWSPNVGLREGIEHTVRWYLNRVGLLTPAELDRRLMQRT